MMTPAETLRTLRDTVDDLDMDDERARRLEHVVGCTEDAADNLAFLDDATATHAQIARINDAHALITQLQRVLLDIAEQEASRWPQRRPALDAMSASKDYRELHGDKEVA